MIKSMAGGECAAAEQQQRQVVQRHLEGLVAKYPSKDKQRQALHAALLSDITSAESWACVLQHEELCLKHAARPDDGTDLLQLLKLAAQTIPPQTNSANHTYMQILSKYLRRLARRNQADARGYFYLLKQQGVGARSALLQHQWARLEADSGNHEKAVSILQKAIRADAQPPEVLHTLLRDLEAQGVRATPSLPILTRPPLSSQARPAAQAALFGTPAAGQRDAGVAPTPGSLFACRPMLATPGGLPAPKGLESAMTAHGAARYSKKPPTGGLTGSVVGGLTSGLTASSLHLTHTHHPLVLDDKTTMSAGSGGTQTTHASSNESNYSIAQLVATPTAGAGAMTVHSTSSRESGSTCEAETVELSRHSAAVGEKPKTVDGTPQVSSAQRPAPRTTGPQPAKSLVFRRLGGRLGPAARLSGGQDPPEAAACPTDSGAGRSASPAGLACPGESAPVVPVTAATAAAVCNNHSSGGAQMAAGSAASQAAEQARPPAPHPALSPVGEDAEEETVPMTANLLARRVLAGRQSLAPPRLQLQVTPRPSAAAAPASALQQGGLQVPDSGADAAQNAEEPTLALSSQRQQTSSAAQHGDIVINAAQEPQPPASASGHQAMEVDTTETRPLSQPPPPIRRQDFGRPPQQVQIDRSGNARLSGVRSPQSRASVRAPPPPPPHFARTSSLPSPSAERPVQPAPARSVEAAAPTGAAPDPQPGGSAAGQQLPAAAQAQQREQQQQAEQPPCRVQEPQPQQQAQPQPQRQQQPRRVLLSNGSTEDETMIVVKNVKYQKLELIGRGGSSKVYKVVSPHRKIFALKRIRLNGHDKESAQGFVDEIHLLRQLQGKENIIQLIDAELISSESSGVIYVVLEYGDIDLARLLAKQEAARRATPSAQPDENFIRLYWQQMLQAVSTIHEARIVHSDLKPANFLMVEGRLKLIDFGIAKAIKSDTTSIARENQVGTLNYMSPEAILGGSNNIRGGPPMKVGRASDIWSLGCILYQMVYGRTPFFTLPFIQKMHAITNPNYAIEFPPLANGELVHAIQRCLDRNPKTRATMQELLQHPFLRPTAVPRPAASGLAKEQVRLLMQVAQATGADIDKLLEAALQQLAAGQQLDVDTVLARATGSAGGVAAAAAMVSATAVSVTAAPAAQAQQTPAGVAVAAVTAAADGGGDTTVVRSGAVDSGSAALRPVTNLPQVAATGVAKAAPAAMTAAGSAVMQR